MIHSTETLGHSDQVYLRARTKGQRGERARGSRGGESGDRTYECRPWTPPSTWADMVLFSNLSSPEYIIDLRERERERELEHHRPERERESASTS